VPRNGNGNDQRVGSSSPGAAPVSPSEDDSETGTPFSEVDVPVTVTTLGEGAFAGLPFPHASARANALHVVREHISTYLITHPHLDHVSGFVINTAAFHNTSRPKRLAALPFTVNAIKTHIFNNIIWPNLTDEEGGVGLVTFQRLAEGGNIALGEGSGRGFIEVCDGLGVKGFKVSHGHCMRGPGPGYKHRGSNVTLPETPGFQHTTLPHLPDARDVTALSFALPAQSAAEAPGPSGLPDTGRKESAQAHPDHCAIDSTAYFIRTESTLTTPKREVLVFGDVEPDALSLTPRTARIWAEAAPKIAAGILTGIFIEVSFTNAQSDAVLFGHLAPRHLLVELSSLADMVKDSRISHSLNKEEARRGRKRKRARKSDTLFIDASERKLKNPHLPRPIDTPFTDDDSMTEYSRDVTGTCTPADASAYSAASTALNFFSGSAEHNRALLAAAFDAPLKGLKVVVIHVKDNMGDGPLVGETILKELKEGERELQERGKALGCTFEISKSGESYWF
jgi:cAMP phosphodiesterase